MSEGGEGKCGVARLPEGRPSAWAELPPELTAAVFGRLAPEAPLSEPTQPPAQLRGAEAAAAARLVCHQWAERLAGGWRALQPQEEGWAEGRAVRWSGLRELDLRLCTASTGEARVAALRPLIALSRLNLRGSVRLTDAWVGRFSHCPPLPASTWGAVRG